MRYGDPPSDPERVEVVTGLLRLAELVRHVEEREAVYEESASIRATEGDRARDALAEIRARQHLLEQPLEAIVEEVTS